MTQDEDKPINFVFKGQRWDLYAQYRPQYPIAVFDHIYSYHRQHNGGFEDALDIGAGNGVITSNLIEQFDHVTFSDVGEQYVEEAKQTFAALSSEKISFLRMGFGEIEPEKLQNARLDLAVAATCLHFLSDARESFLSRVASVLKPGGTFAAIGYTGRPYYPGNEPGFKDHNAVSQGLMDYFHSNFMPDSDSGPGALMGARLDYLDFDPHLWSNVKRTHAHYDKVAVSEGYSKAQSRVKKDVESVETFENQGMIARDADYEWIEGYYVNLYPAMDPRIICKEQLAGLKQAMGDRTVRLEWPFDTVLATRR